MLAHTVAETTFYRLASLFELSDDDRQDRIQSTARMHCRSEVLPSKHDSLFKLEVHGVVREGATFLTGTVHGRCSVLADISENPAPARDGGSFSK